MTKDEMIEAIKQMTVIELADLVKALEEEFGVSAAAPVAVAAGAAPAAAEDAGPDEEQTEFTILHRASISIYYLVEHIPFCAMKPQRILSAIPQNSPNVS